MTLQDDIGRIVLASSATAAKQFCRGDASSREKACSYFANLESVVTNYDTPDVFIPALNEVKRQASGYMQDYISAATTSLVVKVPIVLSGLGCAWLAAFQRMAPQPDIPLFLAGLAGTVLFGVPTYKIIKKGFVDKKFFDTMEAARDASFIHWREAFRKNEHSIRKNVNSFYELRGTYSAR